MPISLAPAVTLKPDVAACGMPSPDEELLDLETPTCSPSSNMFNSPEYLFVTDKEGFKRPRRTGEVICAEMELRDLLQEDNIDLRDPRVAPLLKVLQGSELWARERGSWQET